MRRPSGSVERRSRGPRTGRFEPIERVGRAEVSRDVGSAVGAPAAWFAGMLADDYQGSATDLKALDRGGWWAVVVGFEGQVRLHRFGRVRRAPLPSPARPWTGPAPLDWHSSLDERAYRAGVEDLRNRIREGDVYQANLCRVLSAPSDPARSDPWALAARLAVGNPAPYAGVIHVPGAGWAPGDWVVSASPELYLRRDGDVVTSSPIKGTARTPSGLSAKDEAENVMIVDLVRNDLQRVCAPGTVGVTSLLSVERHPGLVHLVSTVTGRLTPGVGWAGLVAATSPAGSVSGAPKTSALTAIRELEPVPRGPYCGAVGWVDADRGVGCLAVGIRTFWHDVDRLRFGTGAGITWGSDPAGEWAETVLKARRLLRLASPDGAEAEAGTDDVTDKATDDEGSARPARAEVEA